ncbi:MAG: hypothetical protein VXZ97_03600 [Pseudomonadota bacterium]|nr:hypothetical protein [Pseudomonadota bacterium]GIS05104.1 MAG: hypothetical protein CM15mP108_2080 [Gammaproteobacteria bacterium]
MLYQIGIILIFVAAALIISKKFMNNNDNLVYEDEMDEDELKKIDEELD